MFAAVREAVERTNEQAAVASDALTLDEQRVLETGGVPIGGQLASPADRGASGEVPRDSRRQPDGRAGSQAA